MNSAAFNVLIKILEYLLTSDPNNNLLDFLFGLSMFDFRENFMKISCFVLNLFSFPSKLTS